MHIKAAEKLLTAAELTSVLTTKNTAQLPILPAGKTGNYDWCYLERDERIIERAINPLAGITESYICDGWLIRKREATDG